MDTLRINRCEVFYAKESTGYVRVVDFGQLAWALGPLRGKGGSSAGGHKMTEIAWRHWSTRSSAASTGSTQRGVYGLGHAERLTGQLLRQVPASRPSIGIHQRQSGVGSPDP